ncbi:MAG: hypothetical protein ACF8CQ_06785 [Rhodopirellula sp. JB044]|uniref:hypothetical protein n=1 Tax=Rhodopirellula sp. JB044 TaxID=3342844 RepID=UPI00370B46BB
MFAVAAIEFATTWAVLIASAAIELALVAVWAELRRRPKSGWRAESFLWSAGAVESTRSARSTTKSALAAGTSGAAKPSTLGRVFFDELSRRLPFRIGV